MTEVQGASPRLRHATERRRLPERSRGSVAVEYTVVTTIVLATLFLPIPLVGTSIVEYMLDAFRGFQANTTVLLSLP